MDFLAISGCETSLCDPDRELGICILTYREHPNFQLNYWTGTAIGFRASCSMWLLANHSFVGGDSTAATRAASMQS